MKNFFRLTFIGLLLMGLMPELFAQFTLSGEFRPRTEYLHGYKKLATKDMNYTLFTNQRTRLNLAYKTEGYKFFVSLQDVRVWGSVPQLHPEAGNFSHLHQAYAEIYLSDNFTLKAGRQEIILDDHRIMGSVGWAPQARSHDAFIFKYGAGKTKVNVGLAFNVGKGAASYKAIQYLWFHTGFGKINTSILALNNGTESSTGTAGTFYTQTVGTRTGIKAGKLSAFVNLYHQMGSDSDSTKVNANLIGLDLGYKASDKLSVGVSYELQSGNDFTSEKPLEENNAFFPLYGTNHKFNGHMDYFYVGSHKRAVGLQDIALKLKYKLTKGFVAAQIHNFSAAADFFKADGKKADKGLGNEIDLSAGFPLAKGVMFKMGYSHMLGSESMELLKGGSKDETSNWAWTMIIVKPTLFTTKK